MSVPTRARRLDQLPPYLFAELDRMKKEMRQSGADVIDLSIGDPDLPTPNFIVEALAEAAAKPENHRYPPYAGTDGFRKAVANWYEDRFNVRLDPDTEVLALIGSKEGLAHVPLAFVNPGDVTLVPDPGYPVYSSATIFAGGTPVTMPLTRENHFKPELSKIARATADKARLLFLNYPNNPTSVVAERSFFEEVVSFAKGREMLVCHDAAYTEVVLGGSEPMSFLQVPGAKEVGLEFHSLSKTFNMTGWRVGFAVGNRDAIAGLAKVKSNIDSSLFTAIQDASVLALENWKSLRDANNRIYSHRAEMVCESLKRLKIQHVPPKATFYVWCEVPTKETSTEFCSRILREIALALVPGVGFGPGGEGYFRIALTASEVRLQEGLKRVERYL